MYALLEESKRRQEHDSMTYLLSKAKVPSNASPPTLLWSPHSTCSLRFPIPCSWGLSLLISAWHLASPKQNTQPSPLEQEVCVRRRLPCRNAVWFSPRLISRTLSLHPLPLAAHRTRSSHSPRCAHPSMARLPSCVLGNAVFGTITKWLPS